MRRVVLCVFAAAVVAYAAPAMVLADLIIEAEAADALDHALIRTGQDLASGGQDVSLQNPWDNPGSAFFWLDAGSISPGNYSLTLFLWSENIGRGAYAELRPGTHLTEDGNWEGDTQFGVPTSGQSAYDPVICRTGWNDGDTSLFTIAAGQDYTLRIHDIPAGDMSYLDKLTFSSVPEPSTVVFLSAGLLSLLAYAWRKQT